MSFDRSTWQFPKNDLIVQTGYLCVTKDEREKTKVLGVRLECRPLLLPHINWSYLESLEERPEISLDYERSFRSIKQFPEKKIRPPFLKRYGEGSVYLFGAHNPVDWKYMDFGQVEGDAIPFSTELHFDFDCEGRIGGAFDHRLACTLQIEHRWEL